MRYQLVGQSDGLWTSVSADGVEEYTLFDDFEDALDAAASLTVMYRHHGDPDPTVEVIERPDLSPRSESR